jgi:hypothetical protein
MNLFGVGNIIPDSLQLVPRHWGIFYPSKCLHNLSKDYPWSNL